MRYIDDFDNLLLRTTGCNDVARSKYGDSYAALDQYLGVTRIARVSYAFGVSNPHSKPNRMA